MRSGMKCTVSAADVKAEATGWIGQHLQFTDYKRKCTAGVMLSVLLFAASRMKSIHDACGRLAGAPSDETLRKALLATLPPQWELQSRINAALGDRLPKRFFHSKRGQRIAIDFTLIPYHGQPAREEREIRRGQPKHGTTHFHAYATAYVVQHGQRYTLAMTAVRGDEDVKAVVQRLLQQVRRLGVKVRFLLVDKEFFNVEVIRYLQAARLPFVMPGFARGRKPPVPRPNSLHEFASRKRGGWGRYSWTNQRGRRATVSIAIVCRNFRGQRGRHGRRTQLYAYWGLRPGSLRWVHETYRQRFGIESSYRQFNECRIRTSTRQPVLRLLYVGLVLILRNVWVWCHLNWLAIRRGPGIVLRNHLLRLREMTLWLEYLIAAEFGLVLTKIIPTQDDPSP
ncbi:MAG: peptide synthetase [Planctomycetota bacterium]|nr:MAG: peptide synthetase [Planctomycetota bacterium]REK20500.1 MAG: peptide synthetase [Planctomycetota bacterium]